MTPTLLRTARTSFLLLCLALPATAAACNLGHKSLLDLSGQELLEIYQRTDCGAEREQLAGSLSELLDAGRMPPDLDAREIRFLRLRLHLELLRLALQNTERGAIDAALMHIDEYAASLHEQTTIAGQSDNLRAEDLHLLQQVEDIADPIRAIVNGRKAPSPQTHFAAMPEWTLRFGFCRTSLMMFVHTATMDPGSEDAWAAVGREELAIQHLLETQWTEGMSYGVAPPRLREFGERMLGKEGYDREVEAALAGIRIDQGALGRTAFIPLLGHWLPLPIAQGSWEGKETVTFQTPDELAAWLRPMLLVDRMRH